MNELSQPSFSEILDWLEGRLTEAEARAMSTRMANAPLAVKADEAWLRSFLADSKLVEPMPPPRVRAQLRQQFTAFTRKLDISLLERLRAALVFDSSWQISAAGLRSVGGESSQRQMVYDSDLAEIALSIQPGHTADRFTLFGQMFPHTGDAPESLSVQLLHNSIEAGLALPDALGEFVFREVRRGEYDLLLSMGTVEILIPELTISALSL